MPSHKASHSPLQELQLIPRTHEHNNEVTICCYRDGVLAALGHDRKVLAVTLSALAIAIRRSYGALHQKSWQAGGSVGARPSASWRHGGYSVGEIVAG